MIERGEVSQKGRLGREDGGERDTFWRWMIRGVREQFQKRQSWFIPYKSTTQICFLGRQFPVSFFFHSKLLLCKKHHMEFMRRIFDNFQCLLGGKFPLHFFIPNAQIYERKNVRTDIYIFMFLQNNLFSNITKGFNFLEKQLH